MKLIYQYLISNLAILGTFAIGKIYITPHFQTLNAHHLIMYLSGLMVAVVIIKADRKVAKR